MNEAKNRKRIPILEIKHDKLLELTQGKTNNTCKKNKKWLLKLFYHLIKQFVSKIMYIIWRVMRIYNYMYNIYIYAYN